MSSKTMRKPFLESAIAIAIAAAALTPAPAIAATTAFYASPYGAGSACTQVSPCSLQSALSAASSDGDTVYLASGEYGFANSATSYTITHAITIAGAPGTNSRGLSNRPEIFSDAGPIIKVDSPTGTVTLRDLTLNNLGSGNALTLLSPTSVDRVSAQSNDTACYVGADAVLLRDSVCASRSGFAALDVEENRAARTVTLRNDTIAQADTNYGLYVSALYGSLTVDVTNTIIVSGNVSISAFASEPGSSATINIDHSNYDGSSGALLIGDNGGFGTTALNAGAGNQTDSPPAFRNAGNYDYHEATGSPTIDAGTASAANGALGLDGDPRSFGTAPDIGAYEYVPAPTATTGAAQPNETGATVNGTVNPNGIETHYWVFYWPQTTGVPQVQETAPVDAGSGTTAIPASVQLTGLQPGTTYDYELAAASGGGVVDNSGTNSFTTTDVPAASTGAPASIDETTATVTGTVTANGLDSSYEVQYGTSPTSLTSTAAGGDAGVGAAPRTVSVALTGLRPATTYYYRVVARNADGPSTNAGTQSLTTLTPPALSMPAVSSLTATSADLSATLAPQGRNTDYRFEYRVGGSAGAFATAASAVLRAGAPASVSAVLNELTPATQYQWQIVATHGTTGAATVSLSGAQFRTNQATTTTGTTTTTTSSPAPAPDPTLGSQSGTSASAPPPSPSAGGSEHARPSITRLRIAPAAAVKGRSLRLTISYRKSEAGTTTFVLVRVLAGVLRGRRCMAQATHGHGHMRRCTRLVTLRERFSHNDLVGMNRFTLRAGRLTTGSYVLIATPRGSSGAAGRANSSRFRVLAQTKRAVRRRRR